MPISGLALIAKNFMHCVIGNFITAVMNELDLIINLRPEVVKKTLWIFSLLNTLTLPSL